jgi:hypothetical protein
MALQGGASFFPTHLLPILLPSWRAPIQRPCWWSLSAAAATAAREGIFQTEVACRPRDISAAFPLIPALPRVQPMSGV